MKETREVSMPMMVLASNGCLAAGGVDRNMSRVEMRNVAHGRMKGGGGVNCMLPSACTANTQSRY